MGHTHALESRFDSFLKASTVTDERTTAMLRAAFNAGWVESMDYFQEERYQDLTRRIDNEVVEIAP